jgi:hypothetical protein
MRSHYVVDDPARATALDHVGDLGGLGNAISEGKALTARMGGRSFLGG